jgi:hypothetical protein
VSEKSVATRILAKGMVKASPLPTAFYDAAGIVI